MNMLHIVLLWATLLATVLPSHADGYVIDDGYHGIITGLSGRVFDGTLLYGGIKEGVGAAVWSTNGLSVELLEITDPNPPLPSYFSRPDLGSTAVVQDDTVYFGAFDAAHGCEVWETDGTSAGTILHDDINPGSADSVPNCALGTAKSLAWGFVFSADDGTNGREPYVCDGLGPCSLLRDIHSGANASFPSRFTVLSPTKVAFSATDGLHGRELW